VYALAKTDTDDLYIGTYQGLYVKKAGQQSVTAVPLPGESGRSNVFVNSLLVNHSTLWVGTEGALYRYERGSATEVPPLRDQSVKSLATDSQGRLLAGTD